MANEVSHLETLSVDDSESCDTGTNQQFRDRRSEGSGADQKDSGFSEIGVEPAKCSELVRVPILARRPMDFSIGPEGPPSTRLPEAKVVCTKAIRHVPFEHWHVDCEPVQLVWRTTDELGYWEAHKQRVRQSIVESRCRSPQRGHQVHALLAKRIGKFLPG